MKVLSVILVAALAIVALPAMATPVSDPWSVPNGSDELNLFEIVNALYGTAYTSSADMAFAMVSAPADEVFSGWAAIKTEAKYAGYEQTFGWYQDTGVGSPTTLNPLYTVTGTGLAATGSAIISPVGDYGFFEAAGPANNPDKYVWYSEADENANGEDHMVLYNLGLLVGQDYAGRYLMGWEDKPFEVSDTDYNDHVLELTGIVPEPASFLLLGMGIAGMIVHRMRKAA